MFENKNFSLGKKTPGATVPDSNNSQNEIDESIPIHTMEKDLASLETHKTDSLQNKNVSFKEISQETKLSKPEPVSLSERTPIPSPFLATAPPKSTPGVTDAPEKKPVPSFFENKMPAELLIKKNSPIDNIPTSSSVKITGSKSIWGKVLHISVTVFIALLFISGGYYYYLIYGASFSGVEKLVGLFQSPVSEKTPPISNSAENIPIEVTEENEETAPVNILFSAKNPNYLALKKEDLNAVKAKEIFIQYGAKIKEQNLVTPIEFIIADENNNPIDFKAFSAALGMNISQEISSRLGENFSLFLYNEDDVVKSGLSISSIEDKGLERAVLLEEKNIAHSLEPIFLSNNYTIIDKEFSSSSHGDAKIRFMNIISPEDLSVDWTVYKNKLMIGTTKMTLRSIIDYTSQTDAPDAPRETIPSENNAQAVDNL
ncbi:MAG: hypothetical protein A2288_02860 [Candidatus Moranbacteria bacterium RIFOXYA12_FULL_44_15]|nr:MAG: hypothetical protein A2288_02860 [Candidatus Moranbacteria bacterium RIFOXYA12_FULL_44_15]OGI35466.1 MAG: hypothetical protein A2259_02465 [Candidatus Moranbacteria bacterium RIFOXYA2_FULL_43_15]